MTRLVVGDHPIDIDLAVFDKDGVLVEFSHTWIQRVQTGVEALVQRARGDELLQQELLRSLGYATETGAVVNDSPLATASLAKLYTIAAAVLYQNGHNWREAEQLVQEAFASVVSALPTKEDVQPIGDVAGLFHQLAGAGARIAVITSDDRAATRETMALLGVTEQVSLLVCGDDPVPNKPAPDGIYHLAAELDVEPSRMMMVGDTASDMLMAKRAGVGCRVGVLSGVGDQLALAVQADIVVTSIKEIRVVGA